jgi:DNA-directed RNA polymerase specialized sigma24 family protein
VRDLDDVLRAIGYETARTAASEARLRRLVELAADDDLAGRVVVERIVPGLLAVVRRRRPVVGDDAFDELLGAAWVAIRTFNPDRRPACLAAALIADADYAAFRRARRRIHPDVRPVADLAHLGDERERHPVDELAELFRDALDAGVPADDIALLRRLLDAPDTQSVADQLQITTRTIRNRRNRIASRLREVTLAA